MSFEDILNQWDENLNINKKRKIVENVKKEDHSMSSFIDLYPPDIEQAEGVKEELTIRQKKRNYRRMKPQKILDLHGFTLLAAEIELDDFLKKCKKKHIEKILIIHGKGLHSKDGEAVLRIWLRNELKSNDLIGEIGHPSEKEGGAGATWAILKY